MHYCFFSFDVFHSTNDLHHKHLEHLVGIFRGGGKIRDKFDIIMGFNFYFGAAFFSKYFAFVFSNVNN